MAVYRQVQTSYWQDDFILSLTPEEKYFYLYLLTNSKTKQCGIYELPLKIIEVETGYNQETIIKLIQRFIENNKIRYDWETKEIALKNWLKHNPDTNPKIKTCVQKELKYVKNTLLIPYIYPIDRVSQKEEEKEEEEKQEQIDKIWQTSFGRNPKLPERELTYKHLSKYGYEKTKNIYKQAVLNGFNKIKTLDESLDENGNIKPKNTLQQQPIRNEPQMSEDLQNIKKKIMEKRNAKK